YRVGGGHLCGRVVVARAGRAEPRRGSAARPPPRRPDREGRVAGRPRTLPARVHGLARWTSAGGLARAGTVNRRDHRDRGCAARRWLPNRRRGDRRRPRRGPPGRPPLWNARARTPRRRAARAAGRSPRQPPRGRARPRARRRGGGGRGGGRRRPARAGLCYRETPVTLRLESGALVEGIVDLAYQAEGEVVVVDFKTDREREGAMETYRRQVQIYAHAIALATGRPTRGVLMKI